MVARLSRFVISVAMVSLPLLASAEGKCNDDPKKWNDGKRDYLLVGWTIPFPDGANVDDNPSTSIIDLLPDTDPSGKPWDPMVLPSEYTSNPVFRDLVRAHPGWAAGKQGFKEPGKLDKWLTDHLEVRLEKEAKPLFTQYVQGGNRLFSFVVEHAPRGDDGLGFRFCTCALQRTVLVLRGNNQETWVKTQFHSARDRTTFENFGPSKPVVFTFPAKKGTSTPKALWFPLALNWILPDPGRPAFLRLDVLVARGQTLGPLPTGFGSTSRGTVQYAGETWSATRIWRRFERSDPAAVDLLIDVQ